MICPVQERGSKNLKDAFHYYEGPKRQEITSATKNVFLHILSKSGLTLPTTANSDISFSVFISGPMIQTYDVTQSKN